MRELVFKSLFFLFGVVGYFQMNVAAQCTIDLGPDLGLCPGQSHTFILPVGNTYVWENLSPLATRTISNAGTYFVTSTNLGPNLIVNGDFELGNTNFTTQYVPGTGGVWGLLSSEGQYTVTTSPTLAHNNFSFCNDHTAAPGVNQLVVNGSGVPGTNVWCQTVPVTPGTNYQFGAWVTNALNDPNVAILQFNINGTPLGATFNTSSIACNWQQYFTVWNSASNTSANICLTNQNTSIGGNDFCLDDITFRPVCIDQDTVIISAKPVPVVNLGPNLTICEIDSVTLDAGNVGSTYLWNTGSTNQTVSANSAGNYSVTVTNPQGCSATDNFTLSEEALKSAGNDSLVVVCSTQGTFDLNTLLSFGTSIGGNWSTITLPTANLTNSIVDFTGIHGQYELKYKVDGVNCPSDSSVHLIRINTQPIAATDVSQNLCSTDSDLDLSPFMIHPNNPNGGAWSLPIGFPVTGINLNTISPTLIPPGDYQLEFILDADSTCVDDVFTFDLHLIQTPIPLFLPSTQSGCEPVEIVFENQSIASAGSEYLWDFGDGSNSTSSTGLAHTYQFAGVYPVSLTIETENLCSATYNLPQDISVYALPQANFEINPQQAFSIDPQVNFNNTSSTHVISSWDFGDGANSNLENPTHLYPLGIASNYEVTLIISTEHGCMDTLSKIVVVKDQLIIYVPNSFTPNGDQFNNIFQPIITSGVEEYGYSFVIYNRWGEIVFESNDIYSGWDGTYKGLKCPDGIYTWVMQYSLDDSDGREEINGHLNLLR